VGIPVQSGSHGDLISELTRGGREKQHSSEDHILVISFCSFVFFFYTSDTVLQGHSSTTVLVMHGVWRNKPPLVKCEKKGGGKGGGKGGTETALGTHPIMISKANIPFMKSMKSGVMVAMTTTDDL
jgi:hypothetical protein